MLICTHAHSYTDTQIDTHTCICNACVHTYVLCMHITVCACLWAVVSHIHEHTPIHINMYTYASYMCVYIWTHTHTYTYIRVCTPMYVRNIYMYRYLSKQIHTCFVSIHIYVSLHVWVCECACEHTTKNIYLHNTYVCTYICVCMYIIVFNLMSANSLLVILVSC